MTEHFDDMRAEDKATIPSNCPKCGAPVDYHEISGAFSVHGSADRRKARKSHGIEAQDGDVIKWRGFNAYCPNEDWQWQMVFG